MQRLILFLFAISSSAKGFRVPTLHLSRACDPLRVASFDIKNTESQSAVETTLLKPLGTLTEYYKQLEAAKKAEAGSLEPLVPVLSPNDAERFTGRAAMIAWAAILMREVFYGLSIADQFNEITTFLKL